MRRRLQRTRRHGIPPAHRLPSRNILRQSLSHLCEPCSWKCKEDGKKKKINPNPTCCHPATARINGYRKDLSLSVRVGAGCCCLLGTGCCCLLHAGCLGRG